MKVAVFYTLFFGIFLAGGVAAQEPRLVLPVGHNDKILSTLIDSAGKRVFSIGNDKSYKVWDMNTGHLLIDRIWPGANPAFLYCSPDGKKIATSAEDNILRIWDAETGEQIAMMKGHLSSIKMAQFSFNGKMIATSSRDKTIKIWDVVTGGLIADLKGIPYTASCMQFNNTGTKIAAASLIENSFLLWDIKSTHLIADQKRHTDRINYIEFDYSGNKIVTASSDGSAIIWNAENGQVITELLGHKKLLKRAMFSPDGKKVVTASWDKTAGVWDATTGKMLFSLDHDKFVNSSAFSNNGNYIVTASDDGTARIWDANTGIPKGVLNEHEHLLIEDARFTADNKKIVTTARDFTIKIWDAKSFKLLKNLSTHVYRFNSAIFNKDGTAILTSSDDNTAKTWNVNYGKINHVFQAHTNIVEDAKYLSDTKKVLTISGDATAILWDNESGKISKHFEGGHRNRISILDISKDETKFLTSSSDFTTVVWDINDIEKPILLPDNDFIVSSARFSPDGNKVVTSDLDDKTFIFDLKKVDAIELKGYPSSIISTCFSPNGENIVTSGFNPVVRVWNSTTGKLLSELIGHSGPVTVVKYSQDGSKILTASDDKTARIWHTETAKQFAELKKHTAEVQVADFSPDGKKILTGSNDNTVKIWDAATGEILWDLKGHSKRISSASFSKDAKKVVSVSDDNTCKVWDLETGNLICTFLSLDSLDYFIQTPNSFYKTTPSAAKLLHYVTKDLKVISFEQLDVKYNRPDKVLEAIGNSDTALIKSYRKAWEKRIKKLGIDTTQFRDGYSVPECDFANREQIEAEQKTETLRLHIKAADSTYRLDRFNVWVNESPLFGQRGISIKRKNSNTLDTIINIKLSQGENRIECSITNVNGTESYRMPLYVNFTPAIKQKESLRFIGIGLDRFSEKGHELQYSVKDIRDLSAKLKEKYGSDIQIDTLFNENVNSKNVKALKKQLQQSSVNDKVILAYSGHGLLSKDYDYYLSTYTVDFNQPEKNGLPYDELENLLDSIPARRKLMLIDACHSGEVDKEEMTRITGATDSLQQQGTKGGKPTYTGKTTLGMKNSFELMQSLFVNVGKSTGATVISAAAGTQFALERGDLKNGVFTYSILEAMNKYPSIKISELRKIVGERVEKLTNGLQKPTSRNETISSDWEL